MIASARIRIFSISSFISSITVSSTNLPKLTRRDSRSHRKQDQGFPIRHSLVNIRENLPYIHF
jgi:hypothetical protein